MFRCLQLSASIKNGALSQPRFPLLPLDFLAPAAVIQRAAHSVVLFPSLDVGKSNLSAPVVAVNPPALAPPVVPLSGLLASHVVDNVLKCGLAHGGFLSSVCLTIYIIQLSVCNEIGF